MNKTRQTFINCFRSSSRCFITKKFLGQKSDESYI